MVKNYLTLAFRNLLKNKVFSGINVSGLGIGLCACMLIFQFVMFELSYDTFFSNYDRIYRVTNDRYQNGKLIQHGTIMYPTIGRAMAADFPEVEAYTRLMPNGGLNIKTEDRFYRGDDSHFADEHFLSILDFPILAGNRNDALKGKYKLVLTESTARKYYRIEDNNLNVAIGKLVYISLEPQPYTVTAICADVPDNSHIQFDVLISYESLFTPEEHDADDSWTWSDMRHYLRLKPGVDHKALESKFEAFSQRHFQGDKVSGSVEKFFLQPLKDAHLFSNYEYDIAKTANGKAVWSLLIVGLFVLAIAWINYINLTTSRALERAKEVGLRKVMGAIRGQLIRQFIFESLLVSLMAFIVAFVLTGLLQRPFNEVIGGNLSAFKIIAGLDADKLLAALGVLILGVVLAAFYPAFVLSSYQPITVLKGKFHRSSRGNVLRKGLVVFQFTASTVLIMGTLIVSSQLRFMDEAELGINFTNMLVVESPDRTPWDSTYITKVQAYESELSEIPGVLNAATSLNVPGSRLGRAFNVRLVGESESSNVTTSFMAVDYHFFDTYDVPVLEGRPFVAGDHHVDWDKINNVIINTSTVRLLGMSSEHDAIGKLVHVRGQQFTIVGVIKDFHQESLKKPMEAIVFVPAYSTWSRTSIKIESGKTKEAMVAIEDIYKKFFPGNSFEYFFAEDYYNRQYSDDSRFGKVVNIFAVLAIIISCLGLIGLSSYTAIQRTKEIGVRKALGASTPGIISLLSMDFLKLILLATLLALPLAYFTMENWLQEYTYRISIGWIMFVIPVVSILFIAGITMSFQIIRTARTNPADTLKYE